MTDFENTYINKKYISEELLKETRKFPLIGLDYPNNGVYADIVLDWWCN